MVFYLFVQSVLRLEGRAVEDRAELLRGEGKASILACKQDTHFCLCVETGGSLWGFFCVSLRPCLRGSLVKPGSGTGTLPCSCTSYMLWPRNGCGSCCVPADLSSEQCWGGALWGVRCKITLGRALPAGDNIGRGSGSILLLPFWLQSPCKNPQGFLEMVSTYMNLSGNNKLDGSQASQNQMSGIRWVHAVHFLFAATLVLTNCSVWMENMHRKGSAPHTQLSYTMSHRLSMFNS